MAHCSPIMAQQYLNHQLECPYCLTIGLRIPANAGLATTTASSLGSVAKMVFATQMLHAPINPA
ncbi:hypothetical protein EN859_028420 [Mesorhizobium sp. M00.F.Ca.ET.216.01.1.1]|nr:hypothetical protein EN859_028420 [Mesorhizobium sp. M00.F.Ca.ET.216.01.1.1]TIS53146.1 MAG: hypothetical protein E5W91_32270 [Mesorhizobium sp.]TIS86183.1 MAG: hypothetical protein E5W89_30305 [Mesorhizobium sp.]TJW03668.1 MAG: hypothetical protein E5W82_32620 [Mesorhizobium sp.]TJW48742.1 MAG: hypothetical protein E5W83_01825 [Mesorhizobium sp.]